MNNEVLELEYEIEFAQMRQVWFAYFKKSLPNVLAFWGVAVALSLVLLLFFNDLYIGSLMTIFAVGAPLLFIFFNYQNYMKAARASYESLTGEDKIVHLTFRQGDDGFDSRNGQSFGHTAWKSISAVEEFADSFVFTRAGHLYYIPKSAFRSAADVGFLRFLISTNIEKNVKLLD